MIKKYIILAVFISFMFENGIAQNVVISGNAPTYAGDIFSFKYNVDLITGLEKELVQCKVSENGDFKVSFPISATIQASVIVGAFRGLIFLEKNTEYEIVLPPKREKTEVDKINPFFREDEFFIGVKNHTKKELNYLIADYNLRYNIYMDKNYIRILKLGYNANVENQIAIFDSIYADIKNPYFIKYKEYKHAALKNLAYVRSNEGMQTKFFGYKSVEYQNVAYMNLFNNIFSNFLSLYSKTEKGKEIPVDILDKKSLATLKMTVKDWDILHSDSLVELVILKGLYDGLLARSYPHEIVKVLLDSMIVHSKIDESKLIAKNILNSSNFLLTDFPAPDFRLHDVNKREVTLANLSERFIYLTFCNLKSYTCLQELEMLKIFHEKYAEYFDIVTISVDENFEETKEYFRTHKYEWKLLSNNSYSKVLSDYQIKAYPTYYLINPDKILKLAPAPSPGDDFEQKFGVIWQAYKNEQQREEYRKND